MKFFHSCNDKIFLLFISFEKTSSFSTWSKTPILDVCNVKNFHVIVMWGKSQKRTWNFYRKWISHPLSMKSSRQSYHNRLKRCKILHKLDHINFFCNENQSCPTYTIEWWKKFKNLPMYSAIFPFYTYCATHEKKAVKLRGKAIT